MSPTPVRERPRTPMPPDRLLELVISAAIVLVLLLAILAGVS
jgi:hypothetical protein